MKFSVCLLAAASLFAALPVSAADAPAIKANAMLKTADGARVGRIDRVQTGTDGAAVAVKIIYRGHYVTIPAETITGNEAGLVTSLTRAEVNKL